MIKKNTKVIFQDGENKGTEEMIGGIPLSKGEIIKVHRGDKILQYEVVEKTVDCYLEGEDQVVHIIYYVKEK